MLTVLHSEASLGWGGQEIRILAELTGLAHRGHRTGLLAVDFRSMLGFIGDLFAGLARVKKHIGQQGRLIGWFRRSTGGYVILSRLATGKGTLSARPTFWEAAVMLLIIAGTIWLWLSMPAATTLL